VPNHITNVLTIHAYEHRGAPDDLIGRVVAAVKCNDEDGQVFDFNRIIPMPSDLAITSGSITHSALALFDDNEARDLLTYERNAGRTIEQLRMSLRTRYLDHPEKGFPTLDDFAERVRSNIEKHGSPDWYRWCTKHWGTKWNAYAVIGGSVDDGTAIYHFQTAWAPPIPVLNKLAATFPAINMDLVWVDEGDDEAHRVYWEDGKQQDDEDEDEGDDENAQATGEPS
jgi:hypothetical protein